MTDTPPFAVAWRTSHTGDEWHFAKKAEFVPSDLDKGIVRDVTHLYAQPSVQISVEEMFSVLKKAYAKIDDVIIGSDPDMAIAELIDIIDAGIKAYEVNPNER